MSALRKPKEGIVPKDLARMAMEASSNINVDATEWALDWMRKNPKWVSQHQDEMMRYWIGHHIRTASSGNHRALRGDAGVGTALQPANILPFQSALTQAVNANWSRMMDAPIWGGKKIADATPDEIRESARNFALNGNSMLRRSRFEIAIAEAAEKNGAGSNEPVRNVLSPTTFEQLWEKSDAA